MGLHFPVILKVMRKVLFSQRKVSNLLFFFFLTLLNINFAEWNVPPAESFVKFLKKEVKTYTQPKRIIITKSTPASFPVHKYILYPVEKKPVPVPLPIETKVPLIVHKQVPHVIKQIIPVSVENNVHSPLHTYKKIRIHLPAEKPLAYPVHIIKKVPVFYPVEKRVPYPVEKRIPYPVTIEKKIPVPVPVPYPVHYEKPIQVPYTIEKPFLFQQFPLHLQKDVSNSYQIPFEKILPSQIPPYNSYKLDFQEHLPFHFVEKPVPQIVSLQSETPHTNPYWYPVQEQVNSEVKPVREEQHDFLPGETVTLPTVPKPDGKPFLLHLLPPSRTYLCLFIRFCAFNFLESQQEGDGRLYSVAHKLYHDLSHRKPPQIVEFGHLAEAQNQWQATFPNQVIFKEKGIVEDAVNKK